MKNWITFQLERIAQKGPLARIGLLLGLLTGITMIAGLVMALTQESLSHEPERAFWWALLRVSDSGYLADDSGSLRKVLTSVLLSISGTAFLVGGVAAVMTQWLDQRLEHLAAGVTPVVLKDHVVILGWSDRSAELARLLLLKPEKKQVVLFIQESYAPALPKIRRQLNSLPGSGRLILRTGRLNHRKHLERTALQKASQLYYPEIDAIATDLDVHAPRWLRTLAALKRVLEDNDAISSGPQLMIELGDLSLKRLAERMLPSAQFLAGDSVIAHELSQLFKGNAPESTASVKKSEGNTLLLLGLSGVSLALVDQLNQRPHPTSLQIVVTPAQVIQLDSIFETFNVSAQQKQLQEQFLKTSRLQLKSEKLRLELVLSSMAFPRLIMQYPLEEVQTIIIFAQRSEEESERADERSLAVLLALSDRQPDETLRPLVISEFLQAESQEVLHIAQAEACISPQLVARQLIELGD